MVGKNRQGEVKNSIGKGEAKELICVTLGHELRGELQERMGVPGSGEQMGKNQNSNSIINKIYIF